MMITRRRAVLACLGMGSFAGIRTWAASPREFWNDKDPAEWSEDEIHRLLTKSPWAKEVRAKSNRSAVGLTGARSDMGEPPQFTGLVRWETALPVREARRRKVTSEVADYYAISVTGLPMMGASNKESTQLQRKGKYPIYPARVATPESEGSMIFFFPRRDQPIKSENKEVVFWIRLRPLQLEVKFDLKEMIYHGQLEL